MEERGPPEPVVPGSSPGGAVMKNKYKDLVLRTRTSTLSTSFDAYN